MHVYPLQFQQQFVIPLLNNGVSKVVQFNFPKGKILPGHKSSSDILVQVISGQVRFQAGQEEALLSAGQLLSLEPNIEHSVEALEDSVMLLIMTPSP